MAKMKQIELLINSLSDLHEADVPPITRAQSKVSGHERAMIYISMRNNLNEEKGMRY
jgi:hypothetical protein